MNSEIVLAYWQIGRELVEYHQRGAARAEYGDQLLDVLSAQLQQRVGRGYSVTNLKYFRLSTGLSLSRLAASTKPQQQVLATALRDLWTSNCHNGHRERIVSLAGYCDLVHPGRKPKWWENPFHLSTTAPHQIRKPP